MRQIKDRFSQNQMSFFEGEDENEEEDDANIQGRSIWRQIPWKPAVLWRRFHYNPGPDMKDARVDTIRQLLPQAMLPDWVHLGGRMVRLLRDQHHPQTHDAILDRLLAQARASVALR